jgi:hypothetical protein
MSITFVDRPPRNVTYEPAENGASPELSPSDVAHIAEIFRTPLTGCYQWDYAAADQKISRLYRLGKQLNWDAEIDIDWTRKFPRDESPIVEMANPFEGWEPFESLSDEQRLEFAWHSQSWSLSQFLHGEQGALLVASQLVSCAPTFEAKQYAASQTFDEARHVEVFAKYLKQQVGFTYPINPHLKALLDKILTDERWDLKFIGMQLIIEGLALAAFNTQKLICTDPVLVDVTELVIRDEARHVAFGVTYMEQFVKSLSPSEVEERAMFAYEACCVMRERLVATEVLEHFGLDPVEGRERMLAGTVMADFRKLLFMRIIPNLKKVGLLTDAVRPLYEELGILEFEDLINDGSIDWARFEEPLPSPEPASAVE